MRILFIALITTILLSSGCRQSNELKERDKPLTDTTNSASLAKFSQDSSKMDKEDDFFIKCSHFNIPNDNNGVYWGTIQGIHDKVDNDSLILYPSVECYDKKSYEIMFAPIYNLNEWNEILKMDTLGRYFEYVSHSGFKNFNIYVFELPIIDPDSMPDMHDFNMIFPCNMKLYKRINDKWEHIASYELETFQEYSYIRFKCLYNRL